MKTLIVSDLHLGHAYQPERAAFLIELFTNADRIILNGDFWDLYTDTFAEFIQSPWKSLFPLLKSKQTIYIEGNHDHQRDTGEEAGLFSTEQCSEYTLTSGKYHLHIEHGHRKLDKKHETSSWIISSFRTVKYNVWFRDPLEKYLIAKDNDSFHRWHMANKEQQLRKYADTLPDNHILVTGHTHLPTFEPENHYINTGYINHNIGYYLLVEDGALTYVKERYAPERKILFTKTAT